MKYFSAYIFVALSLCSCSKKDKKIEKDDSPGIFSKSANSIKSGALSVKDYVIESDSVKQQKKAQYDKLMSSKYPEYLSIIKFFKTPSPYLLERDGRVFRITDLKITHNGSIIHKTDEFPDEVQYFYEADDNYYIYSFDISEKAKPICTSIRRIKKGRFSQPVHDLIFENGKLIKENFVADVSKDFYNKKNQQYFEIQKKIESSKIINLYSLGPKQKF